MLRQTSQHPCTNPSLFNNISDHKTNSATLLFLLTGVVNSYINSLPPMCFISHSSLLVVSSFLSATLSAAVSSSIFHFQPFFKTYRFSSLHLFYLAFDSASLLILFSLHERLAFASHFFPIFPHYDPLSA